MGKPYWMKVAADSTGAYRGHSLPKFFGISKIQWRELLSMSWSECCSGATTQAQNGVLMWLTDIAASRKKGCGEHGMEDMERKTPSPHGR